MGKQLTVKDYVWSLVFLLMLVCIAAAFFFGVKVGKDNTEKRFEHLVEQNRQIPEELKSYDQQYLVSFYHTIYLPYREFEKKWFEHMETIEIGNETVDPAALLRELEKTADQKYEAIEVTHIPETSPRLVQAHENYLKSLKMFSEAVGQDRLQNLKGTELARAIESDEYVREAKNFALTAQEDFFYSVVKWHESSDSSVSVPDWQPDQALKPETWTGFPLNVKNYTVAAILRENGWYRNVYPQDITVNVEAFIRNGQHETLNLESVQDIVNTLIQTRAVRPSDFIEWKDRYYSRETLPQIPFFFGPH